MADQAMETNAMPRLDYTIDLGVDRVCKRRALAAPEFLDIASSKGTLFSVSSSFLI